MKFFATAFAAFLATASAGTLKHVSGDVIEGEYVVSMKASATFADLDKAAAKCFSKNIYRNLPGFKAFSARLNADDITAMLSDPTIDIIEPNMVMRAIGGVRGNATATAEDACSTTQTGSQSWGQSRTTRLSGTGNYEHEPSWGAGVSVYVIDTGTVCAHEDFTSDCECGPDYGAIFNPADGCDDGNGHGSHCSSTATGTVYGIAKAAKVIGVKVLSNLGMGSTAGVISGMDWVAGRGSGSVASMSLGGGSCTQMDRAVTSMVSAGVTVVVAAGNDNRDACGYSPAGADSAITVGSTQEGNDSRSSFSNIGRCVDIFAPGSSIIAASNQPGRTNTYSGTSMACPHVAGAAAAILSENPSLSPAGVRSALLNLALDGVINNPGSNSPNKLLHLEC